MLSVGTFGKTQKAFIKDWLVGQPKLIQVGEKIGDSELTSVAEDKKSVQMKSATKVDFTLKLSTSAR